MASIDAGHCEDLEVCLTMRRLWLFLKHRILPQADWNEELRGHQAMRTEWFQERGHSYREASTLAQRAFGNELRWSEAVRDIYPAHQLQDLAQDLRHGVRMLWRQPGFTASVALTMILAIAPATTIFSVVDPLLFRPLPFTDGERLVSVGLLGPIDTNEFALGGMYLDWRQQQTAFAAMTSMRPGTQCDLELPQLQHVTCVAVERSFLPTLGVQPSLGRNFNAPEDEPHGPDAVLISDRLWRSVLRSDPNALYRLVKLDDRQTRIVGILPPNFVLPQGGEVDVLQPAKLDPVVLLAPDATVFLRTFARLRPDMSLAMARVRMQVLLQHSIVTQVPLSLRREVRPVIRSVRDRSIQEAKLSSSMLLGAVGLLLLLACFTIANLFLARAASRHDELSMRTMLGASRGRLSRQVTSELLLLCVPGGLLGCAVGAGATRFLVHVAPSGFRGLAAVRVNERVVLFSVVMTLGVALLSGVLPVFRNTTATIVRSWQSISFERAIMRQILVAGQLTVSLVLLTGACLFGRSLQKLQSEAVGFEAGQVLAVSIDLPHSRYGDPAQERAFCNDIEERLQ